MCLSAAEFFNNGFSHKFWVGFLPVKSLNWMAAWLTNIDRPSTVVAPE
jgi:hypothetical protein